MSVAIKIDPFGVVQDPTIVLATRNGTKLGDMSAYNVVFNESLTAGREMSFKIDKADNRLWEDLQDFKLIWVKDYDIWFEVYVSLEEGSDSVKIVTARSLGEAELSQINVYGLEVNTDNEIAQNGYKPTILFDDQKPERSLLNRLLSGAPHYKIKHVDYSIASIQRVFTFDDVTIYDALQTISKEIHCIFLIGSGSDEYGNIERSISVYDLEAFCNECGYREEFTGTCPHCGSDNINPGFGEFTTIYVDTDNLADNIKYSSNTGAVKNCFRLVAGDDLLTATIADCNPSGSPYIWFISDKAKADMSEVLLESLTAYDEQYNYYVNDHVAILTGDELTAYNALIDKYSVVNNDLQTAAETVTGYHDLVAGLYDVADFGNFLTSGYCPEYEVASVETQAASINQTSLSPVAVNKLDNLDVDSAANAALAMAQTIVDPGFTVSVAYKDYIPPYLSVSFDVSDGSVSVRTDTITVEIVDTVTDFIEQKVLKKIASYRQQIPDILRLFASDALAFKSLLNDYGLDHLSAIRDCSTAILNVLIEDNVADKDIWTNQDPDLYTLLYLPYYNKSELVLNEYTERKKEVGKIAAFYNFINAIKLDIQSKLDFQAALGDNWLEFVAYKREDTYSNLGYISDGLSSKELYKTAVEFIKVAKKEIYKSANLQHSITATLKNLLAMQEFKPITKYFAVGNWIQVKVDGVLYRLRLLEYEIDYDALANIGIVFSDVYNAENGVSDIESIINAAESMASSYPTLQKQMGQTAKTSDLLESWVSKGIDLTHTKIVMGAENQNITWDNHGLLAREYLPITDTYDDKQLKIINKGLYLTADNWLTSKAGIGNFTFYNPISREYEQSYGVIADTLVGNLILGEKVGIYNKDNSVVLDKDGLTITANGEENANQTSFVIQKATYDESGNEVLTPALYVDASGDLVLNGSIRINSTADSTLSSLDDLADPNRYSAQIGEAVHAQTQVIYDTIDERYYDVIDRVTQQIDAYKAEVGQYMQFDENGLTLGAQSSEFKTVIDNRGLYFKQGNVTVSYVNNNQLYIPNVVVENALVMGDFFYSPRPDGGVSLTWQGG